MRFHLKSFAIGILVTILLFTCIFADPIKKTVDIYYNNIKIYVDGTMIHPKDSEGTVVEPFILNGTTYLPIRAVGAAIGKTVTWEGKTNSIYLGKYNASQPSTYLSEQDYFTYQKSDRDIYWNLWDSEKDKDSTGKYYSNGYKIGMSYWNKDGWQYKEFLVNQKYKKLKGTFCVHYDSRDYNAENYLKIYGDGNLLYTSPVMKAGVLPEQFEVDITGVIKLKIMLEQKSLDEWKYMEYGLTDIYLYE